MHRYSLLIRPFAMSICKLCTELARNTEKSITDASIDLDAVNDALRRIRLVERGGLSVDVDKVVATRTANCLGIACVGVSMLRYLGYGTDRVYVGIGSSAVMGLGYIHAWILLRGETPGDLTYIDPTDIRVCHASAHCFLESYSLFLVFNDDIAATKAAERQRLIFGSGGGAVVAESAAVAKEPHILFAPPSLRLP